MDCPEIWNWDMSWIIRLGSIRCLQLCQRRSIREISFLIRCLALLTQYFVYEGFITKVYGVYWGSPFFTDINVTIFLLISIGGLPGEIINSAEIIWLNIQGNSRNGFGWYRISCLLHFIHYLSNPLGTHRWSDIILTLFENSPVL